MKKIMVFPVFCLLILISAREILACGVGLEEVKARRQCTNPEFCKVQVEVQNGQRAALHCVMDKEPEANQVWDLLAWAGGGGDWAEVDRKAWLPASGRALLSGRGQSWVLVQPEGGALWGNLETKSKVTIFRVRLWDEASKPPEALTWIHDGTASPFADFTLLGSEMCLLKTPLHCRWQHAELSSLQADLQGKRLLMRFQNTTDDLPFPHRGNFDQLSKTQQVEAVEEMRTWLYHEYALAIKVFIHSTPGLFNWQPWHWMQQAYQGMPKQEALIALLKSPHPPREIILFQKRLRHGQQLQILMDTKGKYSLQVDP